MNPREQKGFSIIELMMVILIMSVIIALAMPSALNSARAYRLHADASGIASQLNIARFRATSQYTPYRMNFDTTNNLWTMDRLNGGYASPTAELSPVTLSTNITFVTTDPFTAKPGTVSNTAMSTAINFNTRGLPVDATSTPPGMPTANSVVYLKNENGLYDAVTVSLGGQVAVWTYSRATSKWVER